MDERRIATGVPRLKEVFGEAVVLKNVAGGGVS